MNDYADFRFAQTRLILRVVHPSRREIRRRPALDTACATSAIDV